ncbi:hypothetical protein ACWOK6_004423, partial [Vibrio vulnificus]
AGLLGMKFECIHSTVRAIATSSARRITKRLRGILNAWHFQFGSALVFTAQWFRLGGGVVHPLTQRYV